MTIEVKGDGLPYPLVRHPMKPGHLTAVPF